jgi:hypothetical protein
MDDNTPEEIKARQWIATINALAFQAELNSVTDEFRYRILAALLSNELKDIGAEKSH